VLAVPKSYRHIFFDWDGCLAKTLNIWFSAIELTLSDHNIHASSTEVVSMFGDLYNGSIRLGIKPDEFLKFKNTVYARVDENLSGISLYEGAEDILKKLKKDGKTIALISSGSRHVLDQMIKNTDVGKYFDLVISGTDVEKRKPHPEGIEKALAHLGSQKASTIMIGDSEHDLKAAQSAGIDSVLFYPDAHTNFYDLEHLKKSNPTYTIRSFKDLEKILDSS
jgi:pyrophosphatase PpaX